MGRIIAIDYGTKRTGIAVTDPLKIIATGLTTVSTQELMPFLLNYVTQNETELFLVGDPKQMNNRPSQSAKAANDFVKQLELKLPHIPVKRVDERFTSKMATQSILQSGLNKTARQDKELVDMVSATILLQTYLSTI